MHRFKMFVKVFLIDVFALMLSLSVVLAEDIYIPDVTQATDAELKEAYEVIVAEQKNRIKSTLLFSKQSESVKKGKSIKLEVIEKDLPENAKEVSCTWKSSDTNIVTVSNGTVKGINSGKAEIICEKTYSNGLVLEAACTVSVFVPISRINIPKALTLGVEKKYKINVEYVPEDATNPRFEFATSDEKIASVNSNGTVTGKAPGTCTILNSRIT